MGYNKHVQRIRTKRHMACQWIPNIFLFLNLNPLFIVIFSQMLGFVSGGEVAI